MEDIIKDKGIFLRDKHVDIMLFFGILFVVMGHNYQLPWFFFPAYSFHMGLFFFISGYLFKVKEGIKEKTSFFLKKIRKQLIPYLFINLTFGIVSYVLAIYDINVTHGLSLHNLFIEPFINGNQFYLNIPSWFILNLFLINIIAQIILFKNSRKLKIILFLIILPITIFAVYKGLNKYFDFRLTLVRTSYGLLFFFMGILFFEFKKIILKYFSSPFLLFIAWSFVSLLKNVYGQITYVILHGDIANKNYLVPIITTFLIIYISYILCYYATFFIKDDSFILKIGQNSFYIMVLHLSVFFLINVCFYFFGKINFDSLSLHYVYYKKEIFFLFYQVPAILIPTFIGIYFSKFKNMLYLNIVNYKKKTLL